MLFKPKIRRKIQLMGLGARLVLRRWRGGPENIEEMHQSGVAGPGPIVTRRIGDLH